MPYKKLILICFSFLFWIWTIPALAQERPIPQIDVTAQDACIFPVGSSVLIGRITFAPIPSPPASHDYSWWWDGDLSRSGVLAAVPAAGGDFPFTIPASQTQQAGNRKFCIDIEASRRGWGANGGNCIALVFTNTPPGTTACPAGSVNSPSSTPTTAATLTGGGGTGTPVPPAATATPTPKCTTEEIQTAIGCVPTKPAEFIQAVSRLLTGMGGGIALLMMIAGASRMITSAGNPDAVKAGSEQFTSAIIGLLFIIFAVLLLKVIGVDILNIPGFTFK